MVAGMKQTLSADDVRIRLQFARAQWAFLVREAPAHKRVDTIQTLGRIGRHIDELEVTLARLEGHPPRA